MAELCVIIPAYNSAATIAVAVASVLQQTWLDLELIVVDDGSSDDTAAIVASENNPRVHLVRHPSNRGAAAARNTGILLARTEFVAFLDADDLWHAEKLSLQLSALRNADDASAISCTGVMLHFVDRAAPPRRHVLEGSSDWLRRLLLGCDLYPGSTMVARRSVFERVGLFDDRMRRLEDWDWLVRYAAAGGHVLTVADPLADIRFRLGKHGKLGELSARQFLVKHAALIESLPPVDRRRLACDLWLQIGGAYALDRWFWDAARVALLSLRHRPAYATRRLVGYGSALVHTRISSHYRN